jgi:hypothetical protein
MVQRCTNPNTESFQYYGARGISVCPQWLNSPAQFLSDMGPCPPGHQIERVDNDGPYAPNNCRWASSAEQSRNTSHTALITYRGETMCLQDWADRTGIRRETIRYRLNKGWSVERALHQPISVWKATEQS